MFTLFQFKTPTRKRLLFSESLSPVFGPENGQNVADLNEQEGIVSIILEINIKESNTDKCMYNTVYLELHSLYLHILLS